MVGGVVLLARSLAVVLVVEGVPVVVVALVAVGLTAAVLVVGEWPGRWC